MAVSILSGMWKDQRRLLLFIDDSIHRNVKAWLKLLRRMARTILARIVWYATKTALQTSQAFFNGVAL
jgi:hypothetical protein